MELLIPTWILSKRSGYRPGTVEHLTRSAAEKLESDGTAQIMVGREMRDMRHPDYEEEVEPLVPGLETREKVVSPEEFAKTSRSKRKLGVPVVTASRPVLVRR